MESDKTRGFEIVTSYQDRGIRLPMRATLHAAGYDIEAAETITLPTFWKQLTRHTLMELKQWIHASPLKIKQADSETPNKILKPTLVPTGIKVYMQEDEYVQIVNRSSNPLKRFLALPNGIGIIDADYYNNSVNEGHLYVQLINFGLKDYTIQKGDRIAQAIFTPFLKADGDTGGLSERNGGFGSSDPR